MTAPATDGCSVGTVDDKVSISLKSEVEQSTWGGHSQAAGDAGAPTTSDAVYRRIRVTSKPQRARDEIP
jgi:hypothetical protein